MARYRISIDILWKDDSEPVVTNTRLNELRDVGLQAMKLDLEPKERANFKIEAAPGHAYHMHFGDQGCSSCTMASSDEAGQDTASAFATLEEKYA